MSESSRIILELEKDIKRLKIENVKLIDKLFQMQYTSLQQDAILKEGAET